MVERKAIFVTPTSFLVLDRWFRDNFKAVRPNQEWMGQIIVVSEGGRQTGWFPYTVSDFHEKFNWLEIAENDFAKVELKKDV